jgi:hypothetical protein
MDDLIKRSDAIEALSRSSIYAWSTEQDLVAHSWAIRILQSLPSADAVPQSEQYKKGFEDAKRAFELEYARESENMRKRNAQLEVMLNAQKAISADAEPKWTCTANFVAEQLDRLRGMTDEEKWEFFKRFFEIKGGDDE